MAFVQLRTEVNNEKDSGYIINANNIESFFELVDTDTKKFRVYLINGEGYDFNQLYYQGKFIYVHTTEQLYSLLTKIERGEIQGESS